MSDELIHPEVHRLVHLYGALPEVKFPDVDQASLNELTARVKERLHEVAQAEAQLDVARRVLEEEQEALLKKAHRLHAWLTVLAETDEGLREKLSAIALPRLRRSQLKVGEGVMEPTEAPKKRGRPRKHPVAASEALFVEATLPG